MGAVQITSTCWRGTLLWVLVEVNQSGLDQKWQHIPDWVAESVRAAVVCSKPAKIKPMNYKMYICRYPAWILALIGWVNGCFAQYQDKTE